MRKSFLYLLSAIVMPIVVSAQPQTNGTYKDDGYTYPQGVIQCFHGPLPTGGTKTTKEKWQAWPTDANLQVFRRTDGSEGVVVKYNSLSNSSTNTRGYYGQLLFTITSYDQSTNTGTVELGGTYSRYSTASNYNVKLFTRQFSKTTGIKSTYNPSNVDENPSYLDRIVIPAQITITSDGNWAGYYQGNNLAGAMFTVTGVSDDCIKNIRNMGFSSSTTVECWLPSTITRIGNNAFCTGVNNNITHYKFYSSLDGSGNPIEDVNSNNVTEIGKSAFFGSSKMTTLPVGSKIQTIGEYAFSSCNSLLSADFSNSPLLTEIAGSCFNWCNSLTSVTFPNSLQSIGNSAFYNCSSLTSVTFPNSLQSIGYSAFQYCSNLSSVTFPNSLKNIGDGIFSYCGGLNNVIFPTHLESIGNRAFVGCGLTSIESLYTALTQNKTLQYIGEDAFISNKISYLKWETADKYHENFRIGSNAFYSQRCELTVEMDAACTTVPEYLRYSGYNPPFGGQTEEIVLSQDDFGNKISLPNCLRVIVPINCISTYRADHVMGQIPLHDYRVKFKWGTFANQTTLNEDLAKNFDQRSYYGLYNITPQQRLIATSAWKNDALCFRPYKILTNGTGGNEEPDPEHPEYENPITGYWYANTVDYWDSDAKTATVIETEDNFFSTDAFAFNMPKTITDLNTFKASVAAKNETSYPQSLMPYTIHTYHPNSAGTGEQVEQLGRKPVPDGMVPANAGIIIDFPKPGYYLVPPAIMEFGEQYRWKYSIDKKHVPFSPESKTQVNLYNENPYFYNYPNFRDFIIRDTLLVQKEKDVLILFRKDDLVALESEVTVEGLQAIFANALIYIQDENGYYTGFDIGYDYTTSDYYPDDNNYYYTWSNAFLSNHSRYLGEYINGTYVSGKVIKNRETEVEYVAHFVDRLYYQDAENPSGLLSTNDLEVYWWNELGMVSDMVSEPYTVGYDTYTDYKSFIKDEVAYVQQTEQVTMTFYKLYRFDNYSSISEMVGIIESGYGYTEEYVPWSVIFDEFMNGSWEEQSYEGSVYKTWIDIWNPLVDFNALGSYFATNHDSENDHNVIIGLPDRYPIFPYWAESPYPFQDAAHDVVHSDINERFPGSLEGGVNNPLNFDYTKFGRMGKGVVLDGSGMPTAYGSFVNLRDIDPKNTESYVDNDIHYVNFVISKGYFVQINTNPLASDAANYINATWTQPNRAYFSVSRNHIPHLIREAEQGGAGAGKLSLFIIPEDNGSTTGITATADDVKNDKWRGGWYTLQGVQLTGKPTQPGIYIHNGRKEAVK